MRTSDTRRRIVDFIRNFIEQHGYAPTMDEIREALRLSSKSLVEYHLRALEEEGIIDRLPELARAMDISGVGKRARAVPLLGTIAAGQPIPVPTEETWYTVPQDIVEVPTEMLPGSTRVFALIVKGKSMIDAFVDDGDIVVLEATAAADNGQIVAAWLSDRQETTLKRIYYEPQRIRLQPANDSMEPIYVEPGNVEVQGRVIAVLRKLEQEGSIQEGDTP